eukprot:scaffold101021_cov48-Phaeocystis_antarctica.AAC.1
MGRAATRVVGAGPISSLPPHELHHVRLRDARSRFVAGKRVECHIVHADGVANEALAGGEQPEDEEGGRPLQRDEVNHLIVTCASVVRVR